MAAVLNGPSGRPPLIFMHSSLPHGPARFLPDGRGYVSHRKAYPGFANGRWTRHQWLADQSFQRHVLQVQYTDALVGELLDRVRAAGLYDEAVIVVTADHGISFRAGQPRRRLTPETMPDLVVVPFIVKLPGQRAGRVDDGAVRTIDALPTIAEAAGVEVPWRTDAMPADDREIDPGAQIAAMDDGRPGTPATWERCSTACASARLTKRGAAPRRLPRRSAAGPGRTQGRERAARARGDRLTGRFRDGRR